MQPLSRRQVVSLISGLAIPMLPAPLSAQQKKSGGTLVIAVEGEPASLTSHFSTDTSAAMVAQNLFNGLVSLDFDFQATPDLATKWDVSADRLTYTFQINPAARWHDGKPVTAADVEFTFNEVLSKTHPFARSWWPNVAEAKATGPHEFVFRLNTPFEPFLALLGSSYATGTLILPKHIYDGSDPKTNKANFAPVGSGPFRFVRWQQGSHIELARNTSYFKPGKPHLDRLIIQIMPDAAARTLSFESGDVDFLHAYVVPYEDVARLRKNPRAQVVERGVESPATNEFLAFNHRHPQLKDKRVRQAIAYAIDRKGILEKTVFGLGKIAHSHLNSGTRWAWTDRHDAYRNRDVAKANALLDEAGFPRAAGRQRFRLRLNWDGGKLQETRAAALIRSDLSDVGIGVDIQPFDRPTFIDRVFLKWDFDLASYSLITGPDPALSVSPRYRTKQIIRAPFVNAMAFSNAEVDELFDSEFKAPDREGRAKMWDRIQQVMMDELPSLPVFEYPNLNLVSAKFADVVNKPNGYLQCREDAYAR